MLNAIYEPYSLGFLKPYLKKNHKMLELGCGIGIMSVLLSKLFHHIDAVDISVEQLKVATERAKKQGIHNIKFIADDVLNLKSLAEKKYDIISREKSGINRSILCKVDDEEFTLQIEEA